MQTIMAPATTKIALSLAFLLYASWSDYKTREVTNRLWAIYAPLALALSLAELLLYNPEKLPLFAVSFGVTATLAIILFYAGAFGGADSKAFMCIALALPFFPETILKPIFTAGISPLAQNIFPLTIFSNAVLFAAASGIYMLLRNLMWRIKTKQKLFEGTLSTETTGKKLVTLITGYKVLIAKLKEKWHVYPIEDIEERGETPPKRKLVVVPKDEGRNEIVERLSKAVEAGEIDAYVWATPGLPMLIFVTVGFIVALLIGDVVWLLVRFVLG